MKSIRLNTLFNKKLGDTYGPSVIVIYLAYTMLTSCGSPEMHWMTTIANSGTYSSPLAIDLTGDGIKDIVMGAGGSKEWENTENGVVAINGANGSILWKVPSRNQMVGTAICLQIDTDNIPDIIIGGRSAQLMAISGKSGQVIWEYLPHQEEYDYQNDTTLLNFFTPTCINDIDGDQKNDILISYGGFVSARPYDTNRPTGYLLLISSATGLLLNKAPMPDRKETYLSPVLLYNGKDSLIVFGSGGETISGNLYLTPLDDLLDNNIDGAILLAEGLTKGFIASPVLIDITNDNISDIIVNGYEGFSLAIDGSQQSLLWKSGQGDGFETHSQPSVVYFNDDSIPDFFVHYSQGEWPYSRKGLQVIIDGETGAQQIIDSLGSLQLSSPVLIPETRRVAHVINEIQPTKNSLESGLPLEKYVSKVFLFDFGQKLTTALKEGDGINMGSNVLVEDLNDDGVLEMVYSYNLNPSDIDNFGGWRIECTQFEHLDMKPKTPDGK